MGTTQHRETKTGLYPSLDLRYHDCLAEPIGRDSLAVDRNVTFSQRKKERNVQMNVPTKEISKVRRWQSFVAVLVVTFLAVAACYYVVRLGGSRDDPLASDTDPTQDGVGLATLVTSRTKTQRATELEVLDANQDGWQTESLADTAARQLRRIADTLVQPGKFSSESCASVVSEDFSSSSLWPTSWENRGVHDSSK